MAVVILITKVKFIKYNSYERHLKLAQFTEHRGSTK
jgi:hypothetical protein